MKDLDFLKSWDYAHRGLFDNKNGIPENSIKAYKLAIEHGYAIELDIQALSDNTFFCFHDSDLTRMVNVDTKSIYDYSYEELSKLKLLNSNESIPKFTDVLNLVNNKVPLLIEVKAHKNFKLHLNALIKILDNYQGKFAVFSFDVRIVNWFKKHRPNYIRGQISSYFHENKKMPKILKFLMKRLFFNKFCKPDFISYNLKYLPNKYVDKQRRKNILVFGYTAKNQDEYNKVKSLYDNVVFDSFIPKK